MPAAFNETAVKIKIIRRRGKCSYPIDESGFYPKTLEAIELHYAPNHALRVTRRELIDILAALQADLEYRDGVIGLAPDTADDTQPQDTAVPSRSLAFGTR